MPSRTTLPWSCPAWLSLSASRFYSKPLPSYQVSTSQRPKRLSSRWLVPLPTPSKTKSMVSSVTVFRCGWGFKFLTVPNTWAFLGPGASIALNWKSPAEKWSYRARVLATAKLAPSLGIRQYNSRSVSVLSYVAQIFPVDKKMLNHERSLLQRTFHDVNHTFPPSHMHRVGEIGIPQPTFLRVIDLPARYRAAERTLKGWEAMYKMSKP